MITNSGIVQAVLFLASMVFSNVLGNLATSMEPGEWRELKGTGLTKELLETRGYNSANFSILQYGAKAVWDPTTQQFLFLGSPHGNPYKFILYSARDNAWRAGPLPVACMNKPHTDQYGCGAHAYHYSSIDVAQGRFLQWVKRKVYQFDLKLERWTPWSTEAPTSMVFGGLSFFPERNQFVVIAGAKANYTYDLKPRVWTQITNPSLTSYHQFVHYNPVHKTVMFGGGNTLTDVYKMDVSGKITQLRDAPVSITACPTTFVPDPVTGDGLLLKKTSFWAHQVKTDSWKKLSSPPSYVEGLSSNSCGKGVVAAPISTYGVVMFLTYSPTKAYLYKHAQATDIENNFEKRGVMVKGGGLKAFPNPFREVVGFRLSVVGKGGVSPQRSLISIFSLNGKLVENLETGNWKPETLWDARGFASGVYWARFRNGKNVFAQKLVLK